MKNGDKVKVKSKDNPIIIQDRNGSLVYTGDDVLTISNISKQGTCTIKGLYCGADVKEIPLDIFRLATEEEISKMNHIDYDILLSKGELCPIYLRHCNKVKDCKDAKEF